MLSLHFSFYVLYDLENQRNFCLSDVYRYTFINYGTTAEVAKLGIMNGDERSFQLSPY